MSDIEDLLSKYIAWKPTDSDYRLGAKLAPGTELEYYQGARKQNPGHVELANLEHESFMEQRSAGEGLVLPPAYYLLKKLLQSNPDLEAMAKETTLGGLLAKPILDDETTEASFDQMMHGIYGALKSKPVL